jgi:hypothetical protein
MTQRPEMIVFERSGRKLRKIVPLADYIGWLHLTLPSQIGYERPVIILPKGEVAMEKNPMT